MAIRSRSYFSIPYLCGAARFARDAHGIESAASVTDAEILAHRALVVAAVTSSVAALESMINEIFSDASEAVGSCVAALPAESREKLSMIWSIPKTSRYSILDKFDVAHLLIAGKRLDRSHHCWHNATWVVRLRNDFVHFEPAWQTHNSDPKSTSLAGVCKFEQALGHAFPENKLADAGNAFFPDKLLGHGCAAWAVKSAIEFADRFWLSINATPHYEAYRHMFSPE